MPVDEEKIMICAFCHTPYTGPSCPKCGAFVHPQFNLADTVEFADALVNALDAEESEVAA